MQTTFSQVRKIYHLPTNSYGLRYVATCSKWTRIAAVHCLYVGISDITHLVWLLLQTNPIHSVGFLLHKSQFMLVRSVCTYSYSMYTCMCAFIHVGLSACCVCMQTAPDIPGRMITMGVSSLNLSKRSLPSTQSRPSTPPSLSCNTCLQRECCNRQDRCTNACVFGTGEQIVTAKRVWLIHHLFTDSRGQFWNTDLTIVAQWKLQHQKVGQ